MIKQYDIKSLNVKICGICDTKTLEFLISNTVDFFGLIFYNKSPRYIDVDKAKNLVNIAKGTITKPVGVFVNYPIATIQEYIDKLDLKFLQLHGNEDEFYIKKIKKNNDINIIKSIGIHNFEDIKLIENYFSADYFLFDYKPNKKNELPGGNSKIFNWKILQDLNISKKWFLSGGINEKNINKALDIINPYGIDVSSGVEEKPGVKSLKKISSLLKKIRKNND